VPTPCRHGSCLRPGMTPPHPGRSSQNQAPAQAHPTHASTRPPATAATMVVPSTTIPRAAPALALALLSILRPGSPCRASHPSGRILIDCLHRLSSTGTIWRATGHPDRQQNLKSTASQGSIDGQSITRCHGIFAS
jgi:hypothetical protein